MSQVKYRAWEVKSKCMLEWITICQTAFNRSTDKGEYGIMYKVFTAIDDDFILMQWTGLNDKNGKEIYTGDIVKWDDGSNGKYWRVAEVFYDSNEAMFSFRIIKCINCKIEKGYVYGGNFAYRDGSELEVIGNIHDNPSLLTTK